MSIDSAYFAGKDYAVKVNGTSVKLSAKGTYELKDVEGDVNVTVEGIPQARARRLRLGTRRQEPLACLPLRRSPRQG